MNEIDISNMLPYGSILDGRYRVEQYLASGGFGNTYAAYDTRFDCRVAVKEFFMRGINHRNPAQNSVEISNTANIEGFNTQLSKFRREAKRIFNLRNEHIVHVIDLFDANGTSYYVMDLIEGESLKDRIRRHPLTEKEVRDVADQLLYALKTVHEAGFFHLDVKPGNIMIDKNNHCILIDFGASKQMATKDGISMSTSSMAYTPGYAPIEQVGQITQHIGPWSDFYAVGATLYNLLTGKNPPEIDPYDTHEDSRIFSYPEAVSNLMKRAISHMMNPDYRKRPQNVEDMNLLIKGKELKKREANTKSGSTNNQSLREIAITQTQVHNQSVNKHDDLKKHKDKQNSHRNKKAVIILSILSLGLVVYFGLLINNNGNHVSSQIYQDKTNNAITVTEESEQVNDGILYDYDKDKEETLDSNFGPMNAAFYNTSWHSTEYGFKVPDIMSHTPDVLIEEYGLSIDRWDYEDVCMSYCPLMGNWAVEEYPDIGSFIAEDIVIKNITYKDDNRSIYSGYTDDGRIWYMKKHVTTGGAVMHANFLSIVYPKSMQPDIDKLIGEVKNY